MDRIRRRLRIYGRVQGVYFRDSARQEALRLGVTGWVRNRLDGSVEVVAEGPREAVEAFVAWCWKGPPAARVDRVDVEEEPHQGEFRTFTVERTV